ncbi:MAG: hypothetical protein NTW87_02605 [Planctomycetota bacterium]|nr:hypothetical protein [Planctomycetota bacterium]
MDEKPKKRPWFQFHLSTAVVLMFVVGGLVWLNTRKIRPYPPLGELPPPASDELVEHNWSIFVGGTIAFPPGSGGPIQCEDFRGWPWHYYVDQSLPCWRSGSEWKLVHKHVLSYLVLIADILVALVILSFVAFLCEWRIRRQSAQAEPPKDGRT